MASEQTADTWSLEIEQHAGDEDYFAAAIYVGSPFAGTYRTVARIPEADPHWDSAAQERTLAEARLMAAAPDLLAALTAQRCFDCGQWIEATPGRRSPCVSCAPAVAAIAKATGQEVASVAAQ